MYRLPANELPSLDSQSDSQPWHGTLILPDARDSPSSGRPARRPEVQVTAAEANGSISTRSWPHRLYAEVRADQSLFDVERYVRVHGVSLAMFMPDRENTENQDNFRSFSRMLSDTRSTAVVPWYGADHLTGAGILLFSTSSSLSMLIGAVFLSTPFPDFRSVSPDRPLYTAYRVLPISTQNLPSIVPSRSMGTGWTSPADAWPSPSSSTYTSPAIQSAVVEAQRQYQYRASPASSSQTYPPTPRYPHPGSYPPATRADDNEQFQDEQDEQDEQPQQSQQYRRWP